MVKDMRLYPTPYGRRAALLLRERIAATKAEDPLRPVTVVVPSNYVGVSTRRLLASGDLGPVAARGNGLAGCSLLTVYRLAELLGAASLAAAGRRPVSTPVVAAAVRRALADSPGMFAPVREHPSTEKELVRVYRELADLSAEHLDRLAATSPRAREVIRLRRAARALLAGSWYDESDLMTAATEAVAAGAPMLGDLGAVLVYLPQDLTTSAGALLRALAGQVPVEVLAGRTGAASADADVDHSLRRLGMAPDEGTDITPAAPTAVVCVSDAEEEVRSAVARVLACARDDVPLERIAVVYPAPEPYARLVAEHLDAAGIAYNGRAVRPLAERVLGRWLLAALGLHDARYARPAVLGLVTGAPVLGPDGRLVTAAGWERVSREAGIVRDRGQWHRQLTRLAEDLRARAAVEAGRDEPREWLISRHRRSAAQADSLRGFTGELFARLAEGRALTAWSDLAAWCKDLARRYLGDERAREGWPEPERAAADRVDEALDRLAGLDHIEGATDVTTFRRTLALELDDDLGRLGQLGEGVLVGTTSAALGVDLDVVVVLGLAEGVFPMRPREDSLLADAERQSVGHELRLRTAQVGTQHRHLLAALASARRQRVLTYPRGDLRRSIERAPSRWLLDAVESLRGHEDARAERALPAHAEWLEQVPSFAGRVRTLAFPSTRQEYALRAMAEGDAAGGGLIEHSLVAGDVALRRGVELVLSRARAGFTRFDGDLSGLDAGLPAPTDPGRITSASQLETWLACPHAYLMQHILRVEPVENPEELLEIDRLERGSLVHEVLERWLRERLQGPLPAPQQPWPALAHARMRALAEAACDAAEQRGVTGHRLLWSRDRQRILVDLERFVGHDDERRHALGLIPHAAEQPFGLPGAETEPISVDLGDGRVLRVRGRIDRLDRVEQDGGLVVTDYKTGGASHYRPIDAGRPLGDGTRLQLALYGLAVREAEQPTGPLRTEYWFTSTKGAFQRLGYELTDEVVDALRKALRLAADGIGAGHFPQRPAEPAWRPSTDCRFCDPDDLGTADRYREWQRVRHADALRDYVAHIEPETFAPSAQPHPAQAIS